MVQFHVNVVAIPAYPFGLDWAMGKYLLKTTLVSFCLLSFLLFLCRSCISLGTCIAAVFTEGNECVLLDYHCTTDINEPMETYISSVTQNIVAPVLVEEQGKYLIQIYHLHILKCGQLTPAGTVNIQIRRRRRRINTNLKRLWLLPLA